MVKIFVQFGRSTEGGDFAPLRAFSRAAGCKIPAPGKSFGPRGMYFPKHPSSRQCTDTVLCIVIKRANKTKYLLPFSHIQSLTAQSKCLQGSWGSSQNATFQEIVLATQNKHTGGNPISASSTSVKHADLMKRNIFSCSSMGGNNTNCHNRSHLSGFHPLTSFIIFRFNIIFVLYSVESTP